MKLSLKKQEHLVYLAIWTAIFLIPLSRLLSGSYSLEEGNAWRWIWSSWRETLPLLFLFLLHNFLIAPMLVEKNRQREYVFFTLLLVAVFCVWIFLSRTAPRPDLGMMGPGVAGRYPGPGGMRDGPHGGRMPFKPMSPEAVKIIIAFLVLGANLAVKLFFQSIHNERKLRTLEQENLNNQLQYLRYQISPHFFMNTLNNIHALVDIDPEQAKNSIVQLSKLMRYVLYEGDKPTIPLEKEIGFLQQYISLMRLRYNDSVRISFSAPEEIPGIGIPPLLFISFVENAFKHGISYREDSFIDISLELSEGRLVFRCRNSVHEEKPRAHEGIGIGNSRHRLDLLYGKDYTMTTDRDGKTYSVTVDIPAT